MYDKSYAKTVRDASGNLHLRYRAIDPATDAIVCTCGKSSCPRARLLPFREHIAELHSTLTTLIDEGFFEAPDSHWHGVLYGLQMAASIEDIEADTSFVYDPIIAEFCEPTIDFDNANSEMASKYVAGTTIFGFLWHAYEVAVGSTALSELRGLLKEERFGERGRRLLESHSLPAADFVGLNEVLRLSKYHLLKGELYEIRLNKITARFPLEGFVQAAEVVREFRNFLFHGEDEIPHHPDWGDSVVSYCRLARFYTTSRLLLYLIQAFAWMEIAPSETAILELGIKRLEMSPREALATLQLVRKHR